MPGPGRCTAAARVCTAVCIRTDPGSFVNHPSLNFLIIPLTCSTISLNRGELTASREMATPTTPEEVMLTLDPEMAMPTPEKRRRKRRLCGTMWWCCCCWSIIIVGAFLTLLIYRSVSAAEPPSAPLIVDVAVRAGAAVNVLGSRCALAAAASAAEQGVLLTHCLSAAAAGTTVFAANHALNGGSCNGAAAAGAVNYTLQGCRKVGFAVTVPVSRTASAVAALYSAPLPAALGLASVETINSTAVVLAPSATPVSCLVSTSQGADACFAVIGAVWRGCCAPLRVRACCCVSSLHSSSFEWCFNAWSRPARVRVLAVIGAVLRGCCAGAPP